MTQAAIRFDDVLLPPHVHGTPVDTGPTGFEIGWDYAHYRLVPPPEHLQPGSPVHQGWRAGQAAFGARTLRPGVHVRKWLQLRLHAWLRGKAFEGLQVTPHLLAQIDVPACPITGEALTRGTCGPSDASVDRVNNAAGYALGNLAVMSARANEAKSDRDWREAMAFARQVELGRLGRIDGLDARQWARLAVLMSFCTPLGHAEAACLPLLLLPPRRLRVLNPVQALQVVLTLRFARAGQPPRIDQVARLFPEPVRPALHAFMTTLLARRVAAGPALDAPALRRALEQAWTNPLLLRRWQRLALRLTPAQCERIVEQAAARGLVDGNLRCLSLAQATEGWALGSGGLACGDSAEPAWPRAARSVRRSPAAPWPLRRAAFAAPAQLSLV